MLPPGSICAEVDGVLRCNSHVCRPPVNDSSSIDDSESGDEFSSHSTEAKCEMSPDDILGEGDQMLNIAKTYPTELFIEFQFNGIIPGFTDSLSFFDIALPSNSRWRCGQWRDLLLGF